MDLILVDRLELKTLLRKRFNYIYMLLSINYNLRIFITGFLSLFEALPSLQGIFKSADWLEREAWDLFGIFFIGHYNLRRILTDYGFIGFPFRKDFPLSGYIEVRYDEMHKTIILEPLELMQEFRFFKLETPWIN
jgi:NADH:ubiquinone oxidoreductase subunit C